MNPIFLNGSTSISQHPDFPAIFPQPMITCGLATRGMEMLFIIATPTQTAQKPENLLDLVYPRRPLPISVVGFVRHVVSVGSLRSIFFRRCEVSVTRRDELSPVAVVDIMYRRGREKLASWELLDCFRSKRDGLAEGKQERERKVVVHVMLQLGERGYRAVMR